jgi:RNA polymerase sigma-70 factor, ECF subfamily
MVAAAHDMMQWTSRHIGRAQQILRQTAEDCATKGEMVKEMTSLIPALRRYAWALLADCSAGDDLVREAVEAMRCHEARSLDRGARIDAFSIVHKLALRRLRADAIRKDAAVVDAATGVSAILAGHEGDQYHRQALSALWQLPEDQREVLLLVSIERLSHAEAAQVLDVPVAALRSRLSLARASFSEAMWRASDAS